MEVVFVVCRHGRSWAECWLGFVDQSCPDARGMWRVCGLVVLARVAYVACRPRWLEGGLAVSCGGWGAPSAIGILRVVGKWY